MTSIYALPVFSRQTSSVSKPSLKKRKRTDPELQLADSGNETSEPEEYTAVISPNERTQRRVSGLPLLADLPRPPFPHRALKPNEDERKSGHTTEEAHDDQSSLRVQHLSSMSAVLHKSLLKKDYARARRALGLILRTDVHGKAIDIRAAGNWAIGAEILFRQHEQYRQPNEATEVRHARRKRGLADAKSYYENLIVQHPFNRSWPDSVNTLDFYLAMFSLWIYVAQAESHELLNDHHAGDDQPFDTSERNEVKLQELNQANEIGADMDRRMVPALYSGNTDLLKLRAMVAEWQADLCDECEDDTILESAVEARIDSSVNNYAMESLSLNEIQDTAQQLSQNAVEARNKANSIYARLGMPVGVID